MGVLGRFLMPIGTGNKTSIRIGFIKIQKRRVLGLIKKIYLPLRDGESPAFAKE
jgi:hypothetical protein